MSNDHEMEYSALMASSRDTSRVGLICWAGSGIAGSMMLSSALAAKNPALLAPVILAIAFGYYANLRARHHVRLIAGYIEEFHEDRNGAQWFSRLKSLESSVGLFAQDWVMTALANVMVLGSVAASWMFAGNGARGELMAGIATGCGIVFAWHSFSETVRLRAMDSGAMWHQAGVRLREVGRRTSRVA